MHRDDDEPTRKNTRGKKRGARRGATTFDLATAWASQRAGVAACPRGCGGVLALIVLPMDRVYGLQCVACGYPSPPFTVVHGVPRVVTKTMRPGEPLD